MASWFPFRLISRRKAAAESPRAMERDERAQEYFQLLDDRLARMETLLEKSTGEISRRIGAIHELVGHIARIEGLSRNLEALLNETAGNISGEIEKVRLFASRLE